MIVLTAVVQALAANNGASMSYASMGQIDEDLLDTE